MNQCEVTFFFKSGREIDIIVTHDQYREFLRNFHLGLGKSLYMVSLHNSEGRVVWFDQNDLSAITVDELND